MDWGLSAFHSITGVNVEFVGGGGEVHTDSAAVLGAAPGVSSEIVTGPWLAICTIISAPNCPDLQQQDTPSCQNWHQNRTAGMEVASLD
jgi:hypothetical protein